MFLFLGKRTVLYFLQDFSQTFLDPLRLLMYSLAAVYFLYKNVDGFTIIYHCNSRKSYRESKSSVISLSPKGIAKKDI